MKTYIIFRVLLFVIFFSIGAAALCGSILCDDLIRYFHNKQLLRMAESSLKQLESLNADYGVLLAQMEKDPNFAERIAPATLGTEPKDKQTIYPQIKPEDLALARQALMEDANQPLAEVMAPPWIRRCCEPPRRTVLFIAGSCLVLISFTFFGAVKTAVREEK